MAVARWLIWTITKTHLASYRLLRGRFPGGRTFLLLTTTGRKSGKQRTVPLSFVRDGENYVVVGSNGGADWPPRWWLNLQSNPSALIQVGTERRRVTAEKASDVDRNRLWPELLKVHAGYDDYARNTAREIPVVLLKPD